MQDMAVFLSSRVHFGRSKRDERGERDSGRDDQGSRGEQRRAKLVGTKSGWSRASKSQRGSEKEEERAESREQRAESREQRAESREEKRGEESRGRAAALFRLAQPLFCII
jgi:hypothetical protein